MVYWACFLGLEILFLRNKYVNLDLIHAKIIFDAVVKGNEERICVRKFRPRFYRDLNVNIDLNLDT